MWSIFKSVVIWGGQADMFYNWESLPPANCSNQYWFSIRCVVCGMNLLIFQEFYLFKLGSFFFGL